jgi:hypothetical protein
VVNKIHDFLITHDICKMSNQLCCIRRGGKMNLYVKRVLFISCIFILFSGGVNISTYAKQSIMETPESVNYPDQDSWNVDFIGQIGGGRTPYAVAVNGNFTYVGVGSYIQILNTADPYMPLLEGRIQILPYGPFDLVVSGSYLYTAAWDYGLQIVDVSNPDSPIAVGSYSTSGSALGVSISGAYAYIADGDCGLVIIDISSPTQPYQVGSVDTPGTAYDVVVSGNYAYVVDDAKGLRVIDISNPVNPHEVGFYDTSGGAIGLAVSGQYAYVADESAGLRIIRISNPSNPIEVGYYDPQYNVWDVAISGVNAYLANEYGGFKVVNVSNPYYPYEIGSCDSLNYAKRLAVLGEFAYVTDMGDDLLWIIAISYPNNPTVVGQHDLSRVANDIVISGEYAYIAYDSAGIGIIDISNPSIPTETSIYNTWDVALGIEVSGSYGYIADGIDGLRVINISNPEAPFETGSYDSPGYANDLVVSGNFAYLSDGLYGLQVINISNLAHPTVIGSLNTPDYARGLTISGTYIYLADSSAGLRILNISNPYQPIEIGYYDSPGDAMDVTVVGNYAYLADGYSGVRVIDISSPGSPIEVGFYDTPGFARGIAISSGTAYIADSSSGLIVLSVINPSTPIEVGYYETINIAVNVSISGDYIYLADTYGGMLILRFTGIRYFSISGHIADSNGNPIPDVNVIADPGYNTYTDSQGNYVIYSGGGKYAVTPNLIGFTFAPLYRTVNIPPDANGVDFTAIPLQINQVEINQGLGTQYDGAQNYVAEKDTALRVFLNAPVLINPENQDVIVKRNGNIVTTLYPQWQSQPTDTLTFLCDRATCENWQAGSYTFEATVNGVAAQITTEFQSQRTLRILAVPITVKDRGEVKSLPDDQWMTAGSYLNAVYPIASDSIQWIQAPELEATWLDLNSGIGQNLLLLYLSLQQPFPCDLPLYPECFDKIIGFIPPIPICDTDGCKLGWTQGDTSSVVMANGEFTYTLNSEVKIIDVDDMEATTAHEVGHSYELGDEYNDCGAQNQCSINPPPYEYFGSPWGGGDCGNQCLSSDAVAWLGPGTGSKVIANVDHPYEVVGRGSLPDMLSFMGSGGHQNNFGITPRIYDHLFNNLSFKYQSQITSESTDRIISAFGWIGQDDSITIEPWYSYTDTLHAQITGTYTIEALDVLSNTLASQGFEVSYYLLSDPSEEIDPALFQVTVPFPQDTAAFRIKHNDTVLKVVPVSQNVPEVSVVYPNGGENWGASEFQTITWTGNDADGDTLSYIVQYSPDTFNWITLGTLITGTQFTIDTCQIAGSDIAKIRVIASDGVNTSSDESDGVFTVGKKVPQAFIQWPLDGMTFHYGESIFLHGYAYDLEDGTLADDAFQWYSDKDGYLGEGKLILANLSFGDHLIITTVVDSNGNSSTDLIHIFIGNRVFLPINMK